MTQPYQALIDVHKEIGINVEHEINDIVFNARSLIELLHENKLKKADRDILIQALNFIENLIQDHHIL